MKPVGTVLVIAGLIAVSAIVPVVAYYAAYYPNWQYHMDIAWDTLDLANATSDPHKISSLLNQSAADIAMIHGNPQWLYPTPNTDIDQIRALMLSTASAVLNQTANASSFAYVQAINSAHGSCRALQDRLDQTEQYTEWSLKAPWGQFEVGFASIMVVVWIVCLAVLAKTYDRWER